MKKILKIFLLIVFILISIYFFIVLLTYYQYNISGEFSNKKPVDINNLSK